MATKHRLGKLNAIPLAAARFAELVTADGFAVLAIRLGHALKAGAYPHDHRDPFDRCWRRNATAKA